MLFNRLIFNTLLDAAMPKDLCLPPTSVDGGSLFILFFLFIYLLMLYSTSAEGL